MKDLTKIRATLETCDATDDTELMGMRYYELHQRALQCGCDNILLDSCYVLRLTTGSGLHLGAQMQIESVEYHNATIAILQ